MAEVDTNAGDSRSEAERFLGIAYKLLQSGDLIGCKHFSIVSQETDPLLECSDQILAVAEVLLAAETRIGHHHDWYAILQLNRADAENPDLVKKQYRRLALLLHPDKNSFAFADSAFKLVTDAWSVLSDSTKKSLFDSDLSSISRITFPTIVEQHQQKQENIRLKIPVWRRGSIRSGILEEVNDFSDVESDDGGDDRSRVSSFWTVCPYCYQLYEYPKIYEGFCLRCQNCRRSFHAILVPSLPSFVPGKEAYYCCWGVFPLGFAGLDSKGKCDEGRFPNWMPPIFPNSQVTDGFS